MLRAVQVTCNVSVLNSLTRAFFGRYSFSSPPPVQVHSIHQRTMISPPEAQSHSLFRRLAPMVLVALVLRLIVAGFLYPERLDPGRDHWHFGGESGRIACSLVEGKGFSSPMATSVDTGPTAWMPPIYPALVALSFR